MKNYVMEGDIIEVTAPYAVLSGQGVLVGSLFGVASDDAPSGEPVRIKTTGVFDLVKVGSQSWAVGALIYWDNAARQTTTVSTGNTLIGKSVRAVGSGSGETIGRVRLNP